MNPCKVCTLDQEHRSAIDEALRSSVPLDEVSRRCGIARSSLHRHLRRHLTTDKNKPTQRSGELITVSEKETATSGTRSSEERVTRPTKGQLLQRIEMLWCEGLDGLATSKEPIYVTRPNGSTLELPGDLRARKGFLGELREILRLQGEATGELVRGQVEANFAIQIVMPGGGAVAPKLGEQSESPVIDVAVIKR
jgi:hypothetical protein